MLEHLNFSRTRRLPVLLQTEATECGLVCLTMIARFYGHDADLNGMRLLHAVSLKGASLQSLIDISGQMDLGSRALRLELEELRRLQLPAILHWDLNHFVVLRSIRGDRLLIHDPARGERKMSLAEASDYFTGVALELLPTAAFKKQIIRKKVELSSLWGRLVGFKRAVVQTLVLSVVLQIVVLASPLYLQLVVDVAITTFDASFLLLLAAAFGALAVINTVASMMRSWTILYFGNQMSFQMVANIVRHLLHLPADYFEKRHVGDIISRIASTGPIQTALTQSVVAAFIDGTMAMVTGIVIFLYSPLLGTIVLVSVLLLLIANISFYPFLRRRQEEAIVTEAKKESHVIESIRAATTIKIFSAQDQRISAWRNLFADSINANVSFGKYQIGLSAFRTLITGLQIVAVVYFGAVLILGDPTVFTIGMLFAFMAYRQNFTQSVASLLEKFVEFRLLGLHLERIADISQAPAEEGCSSLAADAISAKGPSAIELRAVRFRYSESDPWALDGVNLTIAPGEFVAITGPSGGGKTTLLKLMLGLYVPTEGQILVDGRPLTDAARIAWRKKIGVVMQDDQLLTGSIAENISFFDPQTDLARVHHAAKLAHVHKEIVDMPMNYLSLVGDMGSMLSGGQKQRVLLARAIYRQPSNLFLDEGTANLDQATEKLIADIVSRSNMTRVVVAHRPYFIQRAERVFYVDSGRVSTLSSQRLEDVTE